MAIVKLNRRLFLKSAGVSIALPYLESAWAGTSQSDRPTPPRTRLVLSWYSLGFHTPNLYPTRPGRDFVPTRYLRHFDGLRNDMSVIRGLYQQGRPGGHGTKAFAWRGYPYASHLESVDVFAGRAIGERNRFANLVIGNNEQSIARNGVAVGSHRSASQLFAAMFIEDSAEARAQFSARIRQGYSILDTLRADTQRRMGTLSPDDARRMDQYLEALRDSERDLQRQEEWSRIPKPRVNVPQPQDIREDGRRIAMQRQFYDLIYLALSSDSTRVVAYLPRDTNGVYADVEGEPGEHHALTHHGMREGHILQLSLIEDAQVRAMADFVRRLKDTRDGNGTLLDHTIVCFGTESNDLSRHAGEHVPIILAGGGFRHGQFLEKNVLVQNLYLTMLRKLGIEREAWANSSGAIGELG